MNEEYLIGTYHFCSEADAKLAQEEIDTIEYLENNMNYSNPAKVLQLYDRALDTKMFTTPVGWDYLNKLRNILIDSGYSELEIRPINVYTYFSHPVEGSITERIKNSPKKANPYKARFYSLLIITIALAITVIAMFGIALSGDTPNMINYRKAIVNEYAEWEQSIKEREDAVREKERMLGDMNEYTEDISR